MLRAKCLGLSLALVALSAASRASAEAPPPAVAASSQRAKEGGLLLGLGLGLFAASYGGPALLYAAADVPDEERAVVEPWIFVPVAGPFVAAVRYAESTVFLRGLGTGAMLAIGTAQILGAGAAVAGAVQLSAPPRTASVRVRPLASPGLLGAELSMMHF